jgi:hypothetical protein
MASSCHSLQNSGILSGAILASGILSGAIDPPHRKFTHSFWKKYLSNPQKNIVHKNEMS